MSWEFFLQALDAVCEVRRAQQSVQRAYNSAERIIENNDNNNNRRQGRVAPFEDDGGEVLMNDDGTLEFFTEDDQYVHQMYADEQISDSELDRIYREVDKDK